MIFLANARMLNETPQERHRVSCREANSYNAHMNKDFARDLERFGPHRGTTPIRRADAQMYCSHLAKTPYENFSVASLLLPRKLIRHFHNVYAYCRWSDDLADETGGGQYALDLLQWWREELMLCYEGHPRHPVMVALKPTIERFNIPPDPFLALLISFEQDQVVKRYETFEELLHYCQGSANPVGHLVLYLCECYDDDRAYLSDHICTGLQLANFWQDVARDYDIGRIYIPLEDLRFFDYSEEDFEKRNYNHSFVELLKFEVDRAKELFYRGYPLVEKIPSTVQADIELFIQGGLGILSKIEQINYNVWERRPVLSKLSKARLLLGAIWQRFRAHFG